MGGVSGTAPGKTIIALEVPTRERLRHVQKLLEMASYRARPKVTADEALSWLLDEHERVSRGTTGAGK